MRESFVFYRSFYEAMEELDIEDKVVIYDAVCEFALNGIMPKLSGVHKAIFRLIEPQLVANQKRYENGKKGGRPKTKTKPKQNQNKTKSEPNVNVNVNDKPNKEGLSLTEKERAKKEQKKAVEKARKLKGGK